MTVDILFEDPRWQDIDLQRLAEVAKNATLRHLGYDAETFGCDLLACDDARIADLNAEFRGKPTPTNVLSWPSEERGADVDGDDPDPLYPEWDAELGDIAISFDTCHREAADAGKTMSDHVTHLMIHAVLHLLGYDHIRDQDATLMEEIEVHILGKLGIDNPYIVD